MKNIFYVMPTLHNSLNRVLRRETPLRNARRPTFSCEEEKEESGFLISIGEAFSRERGRQTTSQVSQSMLTRYWNR